MDFAANRDRGHSRHRELVALIFSRRGTLAVAVTLAVACAREQAVAEAAEKKTAEDAAAKLAARKKAAADAAKKVVEEKAAAEKKAADEGRGRGAPRGAGSRPRSPPGRSRPRPRGWGTWRRAPRPPGRSLAAWFLFHSWCIGRTVRSTIRTKLDRPVKRRCRESSDAGKR